LIIKVSGDNIPETFFYAFTGTMFSPFWKILGCHSLTAYLGSRNIENFLTFLQNDHMRIRNRLLRIYLIAIVCPVSALCYAQQPDTSNRTYYKSTLIVPKQDAPTVTSKTVNEKKDLIINTRMDTLSVIFQNTLIPIRSFSQLDSFIRGNLIGMAKPRVEIRGYPGDTSENFDRVIAILKKNKISDFTFSMAAAAP
jgi:hypothetical protein